MKLNYIYNCRCYKLIQIFAKTTYNYIYNCRLYKSIQYFCLKKLISFWSKPIFFPDIKNSIHLSIKTPQSPLKFNWKKTHNHIAFLKNTTNITIQTLENVPIFLSWISFDIGVWEFSHVFLYIEASLKKIGRSQNVWEHNP